MRVAAYEKGVDEGRCGALSWERKRKREGGERSGSAVPVKTARSALLMLLVDSINTVMAMVDESVMRDVLVQSGDLDFG